MFTADSSTVEVLAFMLPSLVGFWLTIALFKAFLTVERRRQE